MKQTSKKNTTVQYLEEAEIGVIVAFRTEIRGTMRTLSGKLVGRVVEAAQDGSPGCRIALVETKNGSMFSVGYEDVVWVKTGDRWPRWIFEELKKK